MKNPCIKCGKFTKSIDYCGACKEEKKIQINQARQVFNIRSYS